MQYVTLSAVNPEDLSMMRIESEILTYGFRAERSVKPFVINRKNFLFADTVEGARSTAIYHTLTETANENGLNPYTFLTHIFRVAAAGDVNRDSALVTALLPENAPNECRAIELIR